LFDFGEVGGGDGSVSRDVRRVVLEINGSGSIGVPNGCDEDEVYSMIYENVKPVLMGILKKELFEEGDMSYEF